MASRSGEYKPLNLPEGKEYTHRAHRFPGKFHPPLIKYIIEEYGDSHDTIADPMCGSGTLAVEAAVEGKKAICGDLDPLACLMTRAKTNPVEPDALRRVGSEILDKTPEFPEESEYTEQEAKKRVEVHLNSTGFCVPMNLNHWFEPYVSVGYAQLLQTANSVLREESSRMEDAVLTVLASMVRRISRADPDPVSGLEVTSVRKEELKEGVDFDVEETYTICLDRLVQGYQQLSEIGDSLGDVTVKRVDAKNFSEECEDIGARPSLVVTSPPYCNAIEYTRRHRLEYEWLGLFQGNEMDDQREARINTSRDFIGSTTPKQATLQDLPTVPHEEIEDLMTTIEEENKRKANLLRKYFLDAHDWLEEIYHLLPKGGMFCLIIGPSTSYGNTIDTPRFLTEIATKNRTQDWAFEKVGVRSYKLKNNTMQYPTNGATTEVEKLVRFKK